MILITQDEAFYLRSLGRDEDIQVSSRTHKGRAKRYYMVETRDNKKDLKAYRRQKIVKTYK